MVRNSKQENNRKISALASGYLYCPNVLGYTGGSGGFLFTQSLTSCRQLNQFLLECFVHHLAEFTGIALEGARAESVGDVALECIAAEPLTAG